MEGCNIIYLVCQFAPGNQRWPQRRSHPCWKPCTCHHGGAPGWRRRPPRGAPSPCAGHRAGSCLGAVRWGVYRWPQPTFGPFLAFAATHPGAASCLCSRQHTRPSAGNMPPPVRGKGNNFKIQLGWFCCCKPLEAGSCTSNQCICPLLVCSRALITS